MDSERTKLFFSYVSPEPNTGCWLWTGAVDRDGYGRFWDGEKMVGAHRYSAMIHNVNLNHPILRHTCDNPTCVHHLHLVGGTYQENQDDRLKANRGGSFRRPKIY